MPNPWRSVPLDDYERHMRSAHVRQLSALSDLFAYALDVCTPESVAILGVAGGNGLERINRDRTRRVLGIDINSTYIETTQQRFADMPGLYLHCLDLAAGINGLDSVQMVHAALIFEHAGLGTCLENAVKLVAPGGSLSVVLQLPSRLSQDPISSESPQSIQGLGPHFHLIEPAHLQEALLKDKFHMMQEEQCALPSGKAFWMGIFKHSNV